MNAEAPSTIDVWCHSCCSEGQANLNPATFEYECDVCSGDCVEKLNQGLEEFNFQEEDPPAPDVANTNDLIQLVMDRILGVGSGTGSNIQQIQVQPTTGNFVFDHFGQGTAVAAPFAPTSSHAHHSVFGLLTSLNSMRNNGQGQTYTHEGPLFGGLMSAADEQATNQWEDFLHYILMNENSHAGAPPVEKSVLDGLRRVNITAETDVTALGECCITQDPFEVGEVMIPLPCGHNYKQEPIVQWLGMHNTCPVCRVAVKTEV